MGGEAKAVSGRPFLPAESEGHSRQEPRPLSLIFLLQQSLLTQGGLWDSKGCVWDSGRIV